MNDSTVPIMPFSGKDIRPRTLGNVPLVSGKKLNQIVRELNRKRRARISNVQMRDDEGYKAGGILQGQGEVILRGGRGTVGTMGTQSRQRHGRDIEEFREGESITEARLNEIVDAINEDIIGCPPPSRVFRQPNEQNIYDLAGVTTYPGLVGNIPGAGLINKTSSDQRGVDGIRVWYKFPEPLDMYEVMVENSRNEWYQLSGSIVDPFGNPAGIWYPKCILVAQNWDEKNISHTTAPGTDYLYRVPAYDSNYGSTYAFQPTGVGSGQVSGFTQAEARRFYWFDIFSNECPLDVYLDSGCTNTVLKILTSFNTIAVDRLKGMNVYYGGVKSKVLSNSLDYIYLETRLDTVPPGGFNTVPFYQQIYGFYIFINSGSNYTNAGCKSLANVRLERYSTFLGAE